MDEKLAQLPLEEGEREGVPLGFRVIYYKEIPKDFSREHNLRNRRFESLVVRCLPCEKPISKIGLNRPPRKEQ